MIEPILGVRNLSYAYRSHGQVVPILKRISFELAAGEIMTLLGPNGSGKSTLMKVASGIFPLQGEGCEGVIQYKGKDFLSGDPAWRAQHIAYVGFDLRAEFPMTAHEAVLLGRTAHGRGMLAHLSRQDREAVQWAMEQCVCWGLRDRDLHTLSGGERQLVALARALAQGAKILFLDESLSQMDLNHQAMVGKLLRQFAAKGWSALLVSHDVNLASEWADTSLLLKKGEIIACGPTRDVLTETRIRALYPGADLVVGSNPVTGAPKVFFGR